MPSTERGARQSGSAVQSRVAPFSPHIPNQLVNLSPLLILNIEAGRSPLDSVLLLPFILCERGHHPIPLQLQSSAAPWSQGTQGQTGATAGHCVPSRHPTLPHQQAMPAPALCHMLAKVAMGLVHQLPFESKHQYRSGGGWCLGGWEPPSWATF